MKENHPNLDLPLLSLPMAAVLIAQFLSALADNALLIAAIALIKAQTGDTSQSDLLQQCFVAPFILLAPFVGPFADSLPKGRVMLLGNGLKLVGASLMYAGIHPLLTYGVVGIGGAAYSPAKYGILTQMFSPEHLVKANGMLEGSTIVAILLGVLLGGILADYSLHLAFLGIIGLYFLAALANLLIPRLPPEHPLPGVKPRVLVMDFWQALKTLVQDRDARFSLFGTGMFWGTGSTLRLALFAWVPVALGITDNSTPADLMGVVSIGIVVGAALAGAFITLVKVNRALLGGLLLGPSVMLLAYSHDLTLTVLMLGLVGICGGSFVVPLNALLQECGHQSIGAGRTLAVQNLVENLMILLFVGGYGWAIKTGVAVVPTIAGFGGVLLVAVLGLIWSRRG